MTTVRLLAQYLRSHPNVCDTSEGIARWWLDCDVPTTVVEAALDWMLTCGVVESLQAADGRTRFRCASGPDRDARLDALAADPQAVMPPSSTSMPRRVH